MRLRLRSLSRAYSVYLLIECAYALFFGIYATMTTVYRVVAAHLNPLQLVLVGTVLEGSIFLCQLPTGVLADTVSRRLSVILGVLLIGSGFLLEGSFTYFPTILCAQALWGIGYTFVSGAEEAWLADEIGTEAAGKAYLRASQLGQGVGIAGIVISVALGSLRVNLPLLVAGGLFLALGAVLALIMPEGDFKRAGATPTHASATESDGLASATPSEQPATSATQPDRPTPVNWTGAFRQTLARSWRLTRNSPILLTILGITFIWGMSSEGFDRLSEAHMLLDIHLPMLGRFNTTVVWFGIFNLSATLLTIGVVEVILRRVNTNSHRSVARALFAATAILTLSVVIFGLTGNFALALALYWLITMIRGVSNPLYTAWVNQHTESRVRATVLSLTGQADAFGQIAGGPIVGAIGAFVALRAAIVTAGAALSPALLLFARALGQRQPEIQPPTSEEGEGAGEADTETAETEAPTMP